MVQPLAINSDYRRTLLEGLELFRGVRADDVAELLAECTRRDLVIGELLLEPGAHNENVFIVLSGALDVHVGGLEHPSLTTLETGACVGEMSIIEDRDPSAFVVATAATHLLVIHQSVLWKMVNASHDLAKNLLVMLSERVRSHNRAIADSYGELRKAELYAATDALTGLGNRHTMEDAFPREIERSRRDADSLSLILLDLDNFKALNDRHGHVAGDRVLATVADVLRQQFRPGDILVRYGGDEFAVLLPGVDCERAELIAERVRVAVADCAIPGEAAPDAMNVTASIGIAELGDDNTLDALLHAADEAMYRAKRKGRNTVSR